MKLSDFIGEKKENSVEFDKKKYEEKLTNVLKENQDVLAEIEKKMEKMGLGIEIQGDSYILTHNSSNVSSVSIPTQTIDESFSNKVLEKAKTLEKELKMQRNKKLVSVLESAPTKRDTSKSKSKKPQAQVSKPEKPSKSNKSLPQKDKIIKPQIKMRPIKSIIK